ncbi:MAG TPA: M48 family metalloprotease [Candidatus Saccharimonadales bacterium]|nr:M48 family metalloprotease [Candidatus Saccharimonadales bacterium]
MYSDIASNKRKTVFIMAVFLAFVALIIWLFSKYLGGSTGVFYGGLAGALIYVAITYYSGAKLALAVNRAREIQKRDNPRLYRIVENLAITDGLPTPRVFIMDDPAPNAFATGRDPKSSAVCVTSGLLDIMDDQELQGVLAHEMGHVKNYDIRVAMVAFALTAIISLLADIMLRLVWFSNNDRDNNNQLFIILGLVAAILAPFVALLIQMAVSRQREYLADATGALTTRYPEGLASALEKIKKTGSVAKHQNTATAHLFFANPLKKGSLTSLFSTHPPLDDRIKRLRDMDTHV